MPAVKIDNLLCYETLLAQASPDYAWPQLDENTACTLCYTSGTTGNPKGVLYSHRSTILHAFAACAADGFALSAKDSILVIVPLFHANAWSLPFSAAMCGAKLVLPGPRLDPESIYMLLEQEGCTKAGGIPTIWLNFLAYIENNRAKLDFSKLKLKLVFSGGTAAPRATVEKFHDLLGVFLLHAWGMTETSPLVTLGSPLGKHDSATEAEIVDMQVKQGRQVSGVELRLVGENGERLPHDGKSVGQLKVRGNWVISGYFKGEGGKVVDDDGWFGTGDVATISPDGYVQLTDRLKDVHQIRRRMDLLDRDRKSRSLASRRVRGGRHCDPASAVAGAAAAAGAPEARHQSNQAIDPGIPVDAHRQILDAGRCDLRGIAAAYRDRQAAQNRASRQIRRSDRCCRVNDAIDSSRTSASARLKSPLRRAASFGQIVSGQKIRSPH
jgi:hypothetical protein